MTLQENINEIDRVLGINDTGALLVTNDNELPDLAEHLAWNTLPANQTVLIDFRNYKADFIDAGWCWGKIGQVIEHPQSVDEMELSAKPVTSIMVGPVNRLYKDSTKRTYADVWRIIRRAIAVSTSTGCNIFFFTLQSNTIK